MTKCLPVVALVVFAATLGACSTDSSRLDSPATPTVEEIDGALPTAEISSRSVYFVSGSFATEPKAQETVAEWVGYLQAHPRVRARLEGNTDERGGKDANLALGERRAKFLAGMLESKGVEASRITVVSYGASRPAAIGHDAASWRINRRVDLILCAHDECAATH